MVMNKKIMLFVVLGMTVSLLDASSKSKNATTQKVAAQKVVAQRVAAQRVADRREQALQSHLGRVSPRAGQVSAQSADRLKAKASISRSEQDLLGSRGSVDSINSDSSESVTAERISPNSTDSDRVEDSVVPRIELTNLELVDVPGLPEAIDADRLIGTGDFVVDPRAIQAFAQEAPLISARTLKPEVMDQVYKTSEIVQVAPPAPVEEMVLPVIKSTEPEGLVLSDDDSVFSQEEDDVRQNNLVAILKGYQLFIDGKSISWLEREKQYLELQSNELASLYHAKIIDRAFSSEQKIKELSEIGKLRQLNSVFLQTVASLIASKTLEQDRKMLQLKRLEEKQKELVNWKSRSFLDKFMSGATFSY